ncbi:flagellar motor protein MotD [Marinobacter sp. R17]|uniref:flagellar motor protein MotD n=1 Tax=Marinobacter TaxID=2742 RepID=UPI000F4BFEDB|nr:MULTISPECIES: flagellar motor protein MotD [Marinobacter]ROU01776.1 flagellar motor protein MotD [Marinobacter sp. R17]
MRRRRAREDDQHNRERWLISYADFITLLFGFFVVMYSVSSVNEGKYKVLSETLTGVFNAPQHSVEPITVGDRISRPEPPAEDQVIAPPVATAPANEANDEEGRSKALESIANQLEDHFQTLINKGLISVETNENWIELSLQNSLLFGSGDAEPHYDAFPVVEKIAGILSGYDNAVRVEGFTDNQPIHTAAYPSNWELSAARAAAVVRLLASNHIDPRRMAAIGYGQYQPVARNDTREGRSRNRRVVLLISRDASIRGAVR